MALETVAHITDLVATNPASNDPKSAGDDHIRNIKTALKTDLPNITGPVTATQVELNYVVGATSAIQTQINLKSPTASPTFTGVPAAPTAAAGTNTTQLATTAFVATSFAPLASPALTGAPTAPTAAAGTNTTQIASTAFVATQAFSTALPVQTGNAGKFVTTDGAAASWANAAILGANTFTAIQTIPAIKTVAIDKGTVSTGTVTFDVSAGSTQKLTVGGALTVAFSNWPAAGTTEVVLIEMTNWGSAVVTLPTINWQLPAGGQTTVFATYMTAIGRAALQSAGDDFGLFWVDTDGALFGKLV